MQHFYVICNDGIAARHWQTTASVISGCQVCKSVCKIPTLAI